MANLPLLYPISRDPLRWGQVRDLGGEPTFTQARQQGEGMVLGILEAQRAAVS